MHGMHGPTVFGYALMPANLVPSYGLNSSTALWTSWESQRLRKKIQTENPREVTQIKTWREWLYELRQATILEEGNLYYKFLVHQVGG